MAREFGNVKREKKRGEMILNEYPTEPPEPPPKVNNATLFFSILMILIGLIAIITT